MQNDPRSHGLWEKTAPAAPDTSALFGEVTADAVIVGAGYTGLSAALHLASRGMRVVVLEAFDIGFGGAGRNVGLINGGMWVMPRELPGVLGPHYGDRLLDLLGGAPLLVRDLVDRYGIACDMERNGTLHCAVGEHGMREIDERCAQWRERGAPVSVLDKEETSALLGTRAYCGALLDKRAGTLQPLAYARGLATAALREGALIHTGSSVEACVRSAGKWTVSTSEGQVHAPWVIVSTDAYSKGPWAGVRNEQVHLPYFNFATPPIGEALCRSILPQRHGCWDTKNILSSFRMDRDGRLVFGSVGALRNTGLAVHRAWAKRALRRIFPQLGDIGFESEWYGSIGMTVDSLPRFHEFSDNIIGFSGYNGRGIAPGTAFGKILAQLVLGEITRSELPLPITDPKPQSFRTLKEAYYEAGAQIAHAASERFRSRS